MIYGLTLPFAFVMPTWSDVPLIMVNGVTNLLGQYWWTRAIHLAPTSVVAPFQYLSLIWAMIFGFAVWGDVPTVGLMFGSAIVVGSGLFLLWNEFGRSEGHPRYEDGRARPRPSVVALTPAIGWRSSRTVRRRRCSEV